MPRPREFDRDRALERAMQIFWRHGYEETSAAMLVEGIGIARSSLYATFGDKERLYAEAVELYVSDLRQRVGGALAAEGPPLEVLEGFLRDVARRGKGGRRVRCCMVVRAALAGPDCPAVVRRRVADAIADLDAAFLALLQRADRAGELRAGLDLEASSRFLTSTFQSLNLAALAGRDTEHQLDLVERAVASLR
ncbi:MAG: TetR/AcrR family transcriptional regulator [Acidobacteria bacterium]|nr:MAG: TetR/AcrR family transcriptional regulator [Acidobacteriota bacterium]REK08730.1 MAG: TetR/AcrR family transcriptional regulator [Acidobacteriota bacterium]